MYDCLATSYGESCCGTTGEGNGSLLMMSFLISFFTSSSVISIFGGVFGCALGFENDLTGFCSSVP